MIVYLVRDKHGKFVKKKEEASFKNPGKFWTPVMEDAMEFQSREDAQDVISINNLDDCAILVVTVATGQ